MIRFAFPSFSVAALAMLLPAALLLWPAYVVHATEVQPDDEKRCPAVLDHNFRVLGEAQQQHLCSAYRGKLLLIVNTASKCAFTPQYDGLEALYSRYREQGLVVLGFPSNDFAGQEPGTEKQISNFCRLTYGVKFPMFEKVHAAQRNASPFYQQLAAMAGEYPRWNFHKYLLAPDGRLLGSFRSQVTPEDTQLLTLIEQNLPGASVQP